MQYIYLFTGLYLLAAGAGYVYQDYKDYGKAALYNQEGWAFMSAGLILSSLSFL